MASYDLKRLEVAIQYIRRMSDGKNPVTNRPAPENEVVPVSAGPADFLLPETARGIPAGRSKNTRPRHNDHIVDARKRISGEESAQRYR